MVFSKFWEERGDSLQNILLARKLQIKYVQRGGLWKRMAELFQEEDTFTKENDRYIKGEMQAFVSSPEGERIARRMVDLKYKGS